MSKETKVGLVVGLGFIVMFAVILSKKAGTVPYAELERDIAVGGEGTVQVVDSTVSPPTPVQETAPTAPEREERIVQSLPIRSDIAPEPQTARRPEYPGLARIELPNVLANQDAARQKPAMTEESPSREPATVVNLPARVTNTPTPPAPAAPATEAPDERVATPSEPQMRQEAQPKTTPKLTKPKPAPPERSPLNDRKIKTKQYIAQSKDTLYKIALMHYGTGHPDGVQRIFDANKDLLKSIDKLKIGQRLRIPAWEGAHGADGFAVPGPGAAVDEKPATVTLAAGKPKSETPATALKKVDPKKNVIQPEQKFRMYKVKPNESFSTIAEREMGTMHLWKELHRANKDKIPTPEKLRVGTKIRIPLNMIAHTDNEED